MVPRGPRRAPSRARLVEAFWVDRLDALQVAAEGEAAAVGDVVRMREELS